MNRFFGMLASCGCGLAIGWMVWGGDVVSEVSRDDTTKVRIGERDTGKNRLNNRLDSTRPATEVRESIDFNLDYYLSIDEPPFDILEGEDFRILLNRLSKMGGMSGLSKWASPSFDFRELGCRRPPYRFSRTRSEEGDLGGRAASVFGFRCDVLSRPYSRRGR